MLTDEIMDQIDEKAGVPKKQQRITRRGKQLTTRRKLKHYNIQENDTSDLPLELYGGTETTDSPVQSAMDTEETATHIDAPNSERKPPKRRASEAGVDVPESADVDTNMEQLKKRHGSTQYNIHKSQKKQFTFRSPREKEKLMDHVVINRRNRKYCTNAEANDMKDNQISEARPENTCDHSNDDIENDEPDRRIPEFTSKELTAAIDSLKKGNLRTAGESKQKISKELMIRQ